MNYECRLTCSRCEYHQSDGVGYKPCKMIDHDKIQLRPAIYGGYTKAYDWNDICCFYEPAKYIKNPSFTNIKDYVDYLDMEWYEPSKYQKRLGISKVKHYRHVTIRIPSKDLEIEIPLYDWIMNTWRNGSMIKFKRVYKLLKNNKENYYKRELIDVSVVDVDKDNFKWYDIGEI